MAQVCKNYTTSTNNIQTRMTKLFGSALNNDKAPLASVYGAIAGLGELGNEVIKAFIIPKVSNIGVRIEFCLDGVGHTQADKTSAQKIKAIIVVGQQGGGQRVANSWKEIWLSYKTLSFILNFRN